MSEWNDLRQEADVAHPPKRNLHRMHVRRVATLIVIASVQCSVDALSSETGGQLPTMRRLRGPLTISQSSIHRR